MCDTMCIISIQLQCIDPRRSSTNQCPALKIELTMQKPILEGLLGKMGNTPPNTWLHTSHLSVSERHLFPLRFSSLMLISSQLPDAGTIVNARWTEACCDCSTVAVLSSSTPSSSSSSSILFLKARTVSTAIPPLPLVLRPPRWKRRGLGIKLSSAQWNSCSSELRVGCLIPSLCSLHSIETMQRMNPERKKKSKFVPGYLICQMSAVGDTTAARGGVKRTIKQS